MKSAISWMAENHVAANLLMILIVVLGLFSVFNVRQEVFPELPLDFINIEVQYRGASPADIEELICIKIEEAVSGIEGIERITSVSYEGIGIVTVQTEFGADIKEIRDNIKAELDRITTFPRDAERPVITEGIVRVEVIAIGVYGDADERTIKTVSNEIREDLLDFDSITQVDIIGIRDYELSIEVSENALREFGITFSEIGDTIRADSLDMPGGKISTEASDILLRTSSLKRSADSYRNIILKSSFDGSVVTIGDIAEIRDGFEESYLKTYFNKKPAALLKVYRIGDQKAIEVADIVREYLIEKEKTLPQGVSITPWDDKTINLRDRINLLIKNAIMGFILVLITLTVFLDARLAFWVAAGILISFLGAFAVMIWTGSSINVITLFAFILVIGIVVDDAIVVGENVFKERENGLLPNEASKAGTIRVSVPVIFAVLTTVAAFAPLLFLEGAIGRVMSNIPVIVIAVILLSLIESLFILPAHLASVKIKHSGRCVSFMCRLSRFSSRILEKFVKNHFTPFLALALKYRYITIAINIFIFFISIGLLTSGIISFNFFTTIESDNMIVLIEMPPDVSISQTEEVVRKVEQSAGMLYDEYIEKYPDLQNRLFKNIFTIIGAQPANEGGPDGRASLFDDPSIAEINIELISSEYRDFPTMELVNRWRELTGPVPEARSVTFQANLFTSGNPIEIELSGNNNESLFNASRILEEMLGEYRGVFDIRNTMETGKDEISFSLKPSASMLGITALDLADQVRQAFLGEEILRIQRGREEVKVILRYSEELRRSVSDILNMRIRTRDGIEVPFFDIAEINRGKGYIAIRRANNRRIITITADVDTSIANSNEINRDIGKRIEKEILPEFTDISYSFQGSQREQARSLRSLAGGYAIALFIIYILLAIPFRSYLQPFIIMSAIPFGLTGAILGHLFLGWGMTIMSLIGVVALSGVVVNDSLVLIDFINKIRKEGKLPLIEGILQGTAGRVRPIFLTSLTTFAGLLPMIFETDIQAQFLIPMAISLGFGVLFSTIIILVFVPCGVMVMDDIIKTVKGNEDIK